MTPYPISSKFIIKHLNFTWHDALWGLDRSLIDEWLLVDLAGDKLCIDLSNPLEIELASVQKYYDRDIRILADKLADQEPANAGASSKRKWLYLHLAWVFANQQNFGDPLKEVESIYADYDYPDEISHFVRFLPPTDGYDPRAHSHAECIQRLYNSWEDYLIRTQRELRQG